MAAILLAFALALAAWGADPAPNPLQAQPVQARTQAVGTLAFGAWEAQTAPAYTRLAVLRLRTAADLGAGRIPRARAEAIQATADRARDQLTLAAAPRGADPSPAQRAALAEAERITTLGYQLLEER